VVVGRRCSLLDSLGAAPSGLRDLCEQQYDGGGDRPRLLAGVDRLERAVAAQSKTEGGAGIERKISGSL
jgi:hypothetical protein